MSSMADTIDFYFDVISPYVYIAETRLRRLAAQVPGLVVSYRPILFAAVLNHWGQRGPAEIPAKREFTFKDVIRRCAEQGLAIRGTATHPFNPLTAQRALLALPLAQRPAGTAAVLRAGWAEGRELGDPAVIADALSSAGLDGPALVARAGDPEIKAALVAETQQAIARGVFGVPSYVVRDEVLWGQDRLSDILPILEGRDPVTPAQLGAMLTRPASASRPASRS